MDVTLVIIKPDGVRRNLIGRLIDHYEQQELKVTGLKMLHLDSMLAERHYGEHKGKSFYNDLIAYITSGPSVAVLLEGYDAIGRVRKINEDLRRSYAVNMTQNTVHGSDSPESAKREIALFFSERAES